MIPSTAASGNDSGRQSIRGQSGYQAIVDHLRREISLGRIVAGDRLPSERRLAEQFGVARETLRQALRILEGSGQIVIQRGAAGGPIVRQVELDPAEILRDVRARSQSILELLEFRTVVESASAGFAAERRSGEDLEKLVDAQVALREASTHDESRRADTVFHLTIAQASGNPMLEHCIEDARAKMFSPVDLLAYEFIKDSSYRAHQRILDAIDSGDSVEAAAAMVAHLDVTRAEFQRIIEGD